jgi:assimilatory nitrate reductase catalytic subunit
MATGLAEHTPLWPAGHLPLKGGDQSAALLSPSCGFEVNAGTAERIISPFEGEMAGRPEGGVQTQGGREIADA